MLTPHVNIADLSLDTCKCALAILPVVFILRDDFTCGNIVCNTYLPKTCFCPVFVRSVLFVCGIMYSPCSFL